jgi:hypothetical protein
MLLKLMVHNEHLLVPKGCGLKLLYKGMISIWFWKTMFIFLFIFHVSKVWYSCNFEIYNSPCFCHVSYTFHIGLLHAFYMFLSMFLPCFYHFLISSFSSFICLKVMHRKTTSFPSNINMPSINHCKVFLIKSSRSKLET